MNFKSSLFLTMLLILLLPSSVSAHGGYAGLLSYLLVAFYIAPGFVVSIILLLINRALRSKEKGTGIKVFSWIVIVSSIFFLVSMVISVSILLQASPKDQALGIGAAFLVSILVGKTGFDYWKLIKS